MTGRPHPSWVTHLPTGVLEGSAILHVIIVSTVYKVQSRQTSVCYGVVLGLEVNCRIVGYKRILLDLHRSNVNDDT
jgi:hypothetical protein